VGAEGGWWMIGGALQDQGSRLPLIVADITIEPTFADGLPLFQRSSCAYQIKSMTYTGEGWTSDPSPPAVCQPKIDKEQLGSPLEDRTDSLAT
ncbi:hypothetical protein, partial [Paracoccus sp. (in: a-proteobacteria)]|uniref:hypothetical protein n=1 Tax=Paracoccus sp. TaxID=267 RepID=UPI00405914C7